MSTMPPPPPSPPPRETTRGTRRRSSVSFQLNDAQHVLLQVSTSITPATTSTTSTVSNAARSVRQALPMPLLVFGLGMAAVGGWAWAAPAFFYAGLEIYKGKSGHTRRVSASGRARRASSGTMTSDLLVERIRGRTLSSKICCICLDSIPEDEPCSDLFDCKHDAQTHQACIDKWLEKNETCPLCRRDVKDPVVEEMRKQPFNAGAQLKGCRFIVLKGWQNQEYQRHFVEVGAAELVATALQNHADNREVVAACCAAVFVLAFASKETQTRLAALGVCERVVTAMGQYEDDAEIQSRGCGAIYSLSLSNKETQHILCILKAPAAVLNALHRFMHDASVAISAADSIMALSCDNRLGQDLLGTGDGAGADLEGKCACELLADLMDRYATERDVIFAGLDATMKLAIDSAHNRLRFGAADMCRKVMNTFGPYQDDEAFLLVALTAVYTMAENQMENQVRLLEGDGAHTLISTLQRHEESQDIVSVGLDVLFALTYDAVDGPNSASHPALRAAGCCPFILKMLQMYPDCPEIYGPGLKAMACLLTSVENQEFITGPEWCKVVCDSMRHSLDLGDVPVLEICCRVVGNLALHSPENQVCLRQEGACAMVCECLRQSFSRWEAVEATADLAHDCPETREELGRHDAVAQVVRFLERNMDNVMCLDIAFMALTNLVQDSPRNAARLQSQRVYGVGSGDGLTEDQGVSIYSFFTNLLKTSTEEGESVCILMMALIIFCVNNPAVQTEVGDAGACEAVVDKISELEHDTVVVRQGVQLMSDLAAAHTQNQDRLRNHGALELLVRLLPVFAEDPLDAARWILTVTVLAEANPNNQLRLMDLQVPEAALRLQQAFPDDDILLDSVLGCLASLAANNRRHQDHIGSLGACELVCHVATKGMENQHFLTRCCSVVLALSELEKLDEDGQPLHIWKDTTYSNKNRLRENGAVSIFSKAIRLNVAQHADPLILGGLILSLALIVEDDMPSNTLLREDGTFQLLTGLMHRYPDHDTLLMAAGGFIATCSVVFNDEWVVWNRFETPVKENQDIFIQGGVIPHILQAMKRLSHDKGTIVMGLISLAALAWQNTEGIHLLLGSLDVIDSVLASEIAKSPDGLFYGLLFLGSLVSFPATDNDPRTLARCRPLIERWDKKAAEYYPNNKCLQKLRGLLMVHVQKSESERLTTDAA